MNVQAKTINLLLYDGSLDGVISIEDSSWNAGELYSAPRNAVADLLKTDACSKYGVYLLLSSKMVYVGQSSDLSKRLNQHIIGKDWWESAIILTTKDDSLNHSDIDYLEYVLIEKAFSVQKLDCDNKKKGNPPKVDKFRKVYLGQYLDEALFLMQLIGVNVFADQHSNKPANKTAGVPVIGSLSTPNPQVIGKRAKTEAIDFINKQGIALDKKVSYAVLQKDSEFCWANPNVSCLDADWSIILNDTSANELILLRIPSGAIKISSDKMPGLKTRSDQPHRIDLKISVKTLIDKISGTDLLKYVTDRIKY